MGYFKVSVTFLRLTLLMIFLLSCQVQESTNSTPSVSTEVAEKTKANIEKNEVATATRVDSDSHAVDMATPSATNSLSSVPISDLFGVQMSRNIERNDEFLQTVSEAANQGNFSFVRYEGLEWQNIEPEQGIRDWPSTFEDVLISFNEHGLRPMIMVRGAPSWAQKVAGSFCGPIKEEALDDFADFMREAVERYSVAPYNVTYWELGNEVDVDPTLVAGDSPFGCWGDMNDAYYGGGYYAEMLKKVYPAIKEADSDAQVIIGGLLLDCDPTHPPENSDCLPAHFLEGILKNGGGDYFDIVAYHAYMYWAPVEQDWDQLHPAWSHRDGTVLGKLDFLRNVLLQNNLDKLLIMNEGGLLCYKSNAKCLGVDAYYDDQANYALRLYTRSTAYDLLGSVWYTLDYPGWQDGALLGENQEPRRAFQAIQFLSALLKNAQFLEDISIFNKTGEKVAEGYLYQKENTEYKIYWTNNSNKITISLPTNAHVYDKLGEDITPSGSKIKFSFEPIIIEVKENE